MWANCRQAMANSTTNSLRQSSLQVQTQSIQLLQPLLPCLVKMGIEPPPHTLQFNCLSRMLSMLSRHKNSNLSSKPSLFSMSNMFSMSNLFSMSSSRSLLHFSAQEQNLKCLEKKGNHLKKTEREGWWMQQYCRQRTGGSNVLQIISTVKNSTMSILCKCWKHQKT